MLLCLDSLNDTTLKAYDDIVIWACKYNTESKWTQQILSAKLQF